MREVEQKTNLALAVLADLPGPKVRLADVDPDPYTFRSGQQFELRADGPPDANGAATTYPGLIGDLREGDRILLAVNAAIVHIAMPQEQLFYTDQQPTTASVLVQTQPGSTLTTEQVQAIVHLVASSVTGLDPKNVT